MLINHCADIKIKSQHDTSVPFYKPNLQAHSGMFFFTYCTFCIIFNNFTEVALIHRSQLAVNALNPSFIPLTNALNEELHGKPSQWKFNKTAFYKQRYEMFSSQCYKIFKTHV